MSPRPVLLRLSFSHYCRKVEACLSQAGIEYDVLDVSLRRMPVPFGAGTVPVLRVEDGLLTDSHQIALWADEHAQPGSVPLRTGDEDVLHWMSWADEVVGPVARRQAYRCAYNDPAAFTDRMFLRMVLRIWRPMILNILKAYKVRRFDQHDEEEGPRILEKIAKGLAATGTGHLVGEHATAADWVVAYLAAPLVGVGPWVGLDQKPGWDEVRAFVAAHQTRFLSRRRRKARSGVLAEWARLESLEEVPLPA